MRGSASRSATRTSEASTASQSIAPSGGAASTSPIAIVCECTSTPISASIARAIAPAPTRIAVSRALERSRIWRTSSSWYFCVPARSAWPGRSSVTRSTSSSTSSVAMRTRQLALSWSLLRSQRAIGEPIVSPWRTPEVISARSVSICWRLPRP